MRWPVMAEETGGEGAGGAGTGESQGTSGEGQGSTEPGSAALLQGDSGLLDWRQGLPEAVRTAPIIQRHATLDSAAQALIEQESMIGRGVYLPDRRSAPKGSDAYLAGMQKVIAKLREYDPELAPPEQAEAYTWELPEGREMDPDSSTFWKTAFHDAGLTTGQVGKIMQAYWQSVQAAENLYAGRAQESYQEGRNALFREFGANTERELQLAEEFVNHFKGGAFGGDAGAKLLEELREAVVPSTGSRLINSPHLVTVFANAKRRLAEGEFPEGEAWQPGQDIAATEKKRFDELQEKRHGINGAVMNDAERAEHAKLLARIAQREQRLQAGRR